jgi:hypothetical protein
MSTLRTCPGGETLVGLLYDDFEPDASPSRDDLLAHVRSCATCSAELESLGGVRMQLSAWTAPDVPLGFEVVRTGKTPPLGWRRTFADWQQRSLRALPAAAAAIIVLGGALALARLDIRYDQAGLSVRTGWGHAAEAASPGDDAAAMRRELASLRGEIQRLGATSAGTVAAASLAPAARDTSAVPVSARANPGGSFAAAQNEALWKRFRQALDESEVRQQQNLQLRMGEITRDFDLQRREDLVQVEQGFGRLNTKNQQMLEQIRQVSVGVPPQ